MPNELSEKVYPDGTVVKLRDDTAREQIAALVKFHCETHSVTSSGAYTSVALDSNVDVSKRQIVAIDFKRSSTYYSFDVLNVGYQLSNTAIVFQNTSAMTFGGSSTFEFRIIWAER